MGAATHTTHGERKTATYPGERVPPDAQQHNQRLPNPQLRLQDDAPRAMSHVGLHLRKPSLQGPLDTPWWKQQLALQEQVWGSLKVACHLLGVLDGAHHGLFIPRSSRCFPEACQTLAHLQQTLASDRAGLIRGAVIRGPLLFEANRRDLR